MHAFLSDLAHRQTNERGRVGENTFVGGNKQTHFISIQQLEIKIYTVRHNYQTSLALNGII